jgi:hypothetical protein
MIMDFFKFDIKLNSLQKNAKAFGFKVKRSGIPPTLKP